MVPKTRRDVTGSFPRPVTAMVGSSERIISMLRNASTARKGMGFAALAVNGDGQDVDGFEWTVAHPR